MQPNLSKVSLNTTNSHRAPSAVRSDTKRDPIGRRTESNRAADAERWLIAKEIRLLLCLISETYVVFPPFNARRIFPAHDTNNSTNSLRKDGSPPSSSHVCRCSGDKRPSPCCTRPLLSARRPAIARPASYPKGACPKRRHNACRRRAERICCLP